MRSATAGVFVYFLVLMGTMGLGISFIWPSLLALSVEVVPPHQRGASAAVFNGTRFFGYSIAPTIFTSIYLRAGLDAAFLLSATMLGLVVGIIYLTAGSYAKTPSR